jgi:RimJ/RimL family protein N-acetyltransferase
MGESLLGLQLATSADSQFVWEVNNAPATRAQSINPASIPWESHQQWFAAKLTDPDCRMWVALIDGVRVGVIRFQLTPPSALVSVALSESHQGRGLGRQLIAEATAMVLAEATTAVAMIRPENVGSVKAFEAAGYVLRGTERQHGVTLLRLEAQRLE